MAVVGLPLLGPSAATADTVLVPPISSASGSTSPAGVVISPDGTRAYVVGPAGTTVSVIDTATNTVVDTITPPSAAFALDLSPDGSLLYLTQHLVDTVVVVDTSTNTVQPGSIAVGDNPNGIAVSPDGTHIYVVNTNGPVGSPRVSVIDAATATVTATLAASGTPRSVVVSPDGARVYVAHGSPTSFDVSVVDTATNTLGSPILMGSNTNQVRAMAFSADGTRLYGTRPLADTVVVIDPATGTVVGVPIAVGDEPSGIAATPDGTRLYVTNTAGNSVSVISTATNAVVSTIAVGAAPRGIAITPDGAFAYVANTTDQTVSVIAIDTFPAITTATVPDATIGVAYPGTPIEVTGTPTPTLALSAGALPPGVTLDPVTGLGGTPTAAGTFTFTLTASSSVSGVASTDVQEYTIEVAAVLPDAPIDLSAALAGEAIDLAWTAPGFDGGALVTGYRIERAVGTGPFSALVADTATTDTTFTDADVQPGTTYTYRVFALNDVGQGPASNEAAAAVPPVQTTTTLSATTPPTIEETTTTTTVDPTSTTTGATTASTTDSTSPTTASTEPSPPVPTTEPPVPPASTSPAPPSSVSELPQTGSRSGPQTLVALMTMLWGAALLLVVRFRASAPPRTR